MKKQLIIIPGLCFAALSTTAFEEAVQAAEQKPQFESKYVSVNPGSALHLRSTPSTAGEVIGKLSKGTQVTVLSESNGWSKITAGGKTGYVSSQYLSGKPASPTSAKPSPPSPVKTATKYVSVNPGSALHLRSTPSTVGAVVGKLSRGTQVTVLSESNGWSKITANGKTGYVSSQYLSGKPASSTSAKPDASSPAQGTTKYVSVNPGSTLNLR
ncbi:SH3 domain-containing protein, partial [Siminovitchia sp. 179-K 8D1 HS]|uniref:SH3 domain-containing protein n=1 Tax=Siminovitchia sp. 179-K 8D1 HS TaxID=3142385 RepID=UPI0039A24081